MKLEGSTTIAADRDTVWKALNDPDVLRASIPGCLSLEKDDGEHFHAKVKQKIGPVSATFDGQVELSNLNPPESYHISGEGKGGAAGFAKGGADVKLTEVEEGTLLEYHAEAKVGGKLAQLGARLIDGVAHKLANQFFSNFKEQVEGAGGATSTEQAAPGASGGAAETPMSAPPDGQPGQPTAPGSPAEAEAEKKGFWKKLFG